MRDGFPPKAEPDVLPLIDVIVAPETCVSFL
jgi:hypothetical protein